MPKLLSVGISLILFSQSSFAQLHNPQFEEWDSLNLRAKPKEWYCPNLCPSPACGPCDKIQQSADDFAVRIHNVMPCVSSDNQAKSRSAGFINDHFVFPHSKFKISYDLIVDSIEAPASFIFTLSGFVWQTDSLQSSRIEHEIDLGHIADSLFIEFRSKGSLKQNALHECDLGYLSATVDNLQITGIVDVQDPDLPQLLVFPNPFHSNLQISDEIMVNEWHILDVSGRTMLNGSVNQLDELENLPNGIYILSVRDNTMIYSKRIVKH